MDLKLTREMKERRILRRNLVKTADRSEKIRTYNYAQVPLKLQVVYFFLRFCRIASLTIVLGYHW